MRNGKEYRFGKPTAVVREDPDVDHEAEAKKLAKQFYDNKEGGNYPLQSWKAGALCVAIWENESMQENGQVSSFKTISCERRYKTPYGEWRSTNTLRVNDLPKMIRLLDKAYDYLIISGEDDHAPLKENYLRNDMRRPENVRE